MKTIDLHAHTTASDGTFTPTQLVEMAQQAGLCALAITDHDTVDGVGEARIAGQRLGVEIVPGVEISTDLAGGTVHILGYFIDPDNKTLCEKLDWAKDVRANRNHKIVARFCELGIEMTYEEVAQKAGGKVVGRPHFAQTLIQKGVVQNIQQAFDEYLGTGKKAYVDKFRFKPDEAVAMIAGAGGAAVLAHPGVYGWTPQTLETELGALAKLGLAGLEVLYTEHTPAQTLIFDDLAGRLGILRTGGSDFHGQSKSKIKLGRGMGDLSVPYEFLEKLKEKVGRS